MPAREFHSERFQICPECDGRHGETEECWRCDGRGAVEPHDPLAPTLSVRVYYAGGIARAVMEEHEPEVQLP